MKQLFTSGLFITSLVVVGSITFVYFQKQPATTFNAFLQVATYILLVSLALFWIIHVVFHKSLRDFTKILQGIRSGKTTSDTPFRNRLFQPLFKEFMTLYSDMQEARSAASFEARLAVEQMAAPWTVDRLKEFTKEVLKDRSLYIVSNREPYIHTRQNGKITVMHPASGIVTAVDPIMKASGGMWIATGSGDADREVVDSENKVRVPVDDPKYELKRVWLTPEEKQGYYYGFSNDGLWPLCHIAHTEPFFRKDDWHEYQKVNEKFAENLLREIKHVRKPLIFIQDYHFTLLPRLIKEKRPDAVIALFWHIPWPSSEVFRICPWRKEILEGMLGADLLAFHVQLHANNFIDTVRRELEALIDLEQFAVQKRGHISYIKPFPIGVPFFHDKNAEATTSQFTMKERNEFLKEFGVSPTEYIGVGVDRFDYTKGILERIRAIEIFLTKYPRYLEKFTFLQITAPTRSTVPNYQRFSQEVIKEVNRVNEKFKTDKWKPIMFYNHHQGKDAIQKAYKSANFCLVTSLHDGMNLVSMEYAAARDDEQGVLILSEFTGASRQLTDALIVNPYDTESVADNIFKALNMPEHEQQKRMKKLRETVSDNNVYRWAAEIIKSMLEIKVS